MRTNSVSWPLPLEGGGEEEGGEEGLEVAAIPHWLRREETGEPGHLAVWIKRDGEDYLALN